jgi:adenine phosphoribosyltransferase
MSISLADYIHAVPDFPKPGILFRDISPLLASPRAFSAAVDQLAAHALELGVSALVAIESRGFIFGAPVAVRAGLPLALVRKPGKLPGATERIEYGLEYGSDSLEIKVGALSVGARVAIIDDVLATGGTAAATASLVLRAGGVVAGCIFLAELRALGGRDKLGDIQVRALLDF